jgi:hypothetical protein
MSGRRMTDEFDDDGRTIADMSDLRGAVKPEHRSMSSIANELQDDEERAMVILGTLKAALSVGLVYVVIFGIVIAIMVAAWT